jgi:hypothetical protein
MRKSSHETWNFHVRKKVRGNNALVLNAAGSTIWVPPVGRKFHIRTVSVYIPAADDPKPDSNGIVGVPGVAASIAITNGTADIVAAVAIPVVNGGFKELTVIPSLVFDKLHPLTLKVTVAGTVATRYNFDLIFTAQKITH